MRITRCTLIVMTTVMGFGSLAYSQQATDAPPLDRNMSTMNRAYRLIKAGASDKSKNDATLAALVQMEQATLAAKGQTPPALEKLTGDEKTKQLTAYRG